MSTGNRTLDDLIGVGICLGVLGVVLVVMQAWELSRRGKR